MQLIFAAEDIHREAAAALVLFQEAARREALSVGTLEKIDPTVLIWSVPTLALPAP